MNNQRRKALKDAMKQMEEAAALLTAAKEAIESIKEEEEEAYDNLPDSFQEGAQGDQMQENINAMDEVIDNLDTQASDIEEYIQSLENL
ncbi:MAG: hypothetical protein IJQ20_06540 [Paludibacteraceae bacterium]|nr:hypothetical protein [Paludibacteraceae bacterium]